MQKFVAYSVFVTAFLSCVEAPPKLSQEAYNSTFPPDGYIADAGTNDVQVEDIEIDTSPPDTFTPPEDIPEPLDVPEPPDVPEIEEDTAPCVPTSEDSDPCDGIDNDCDGETDEDGGPPKAVADFTTPQGWLVNGPKGTIAHSTGPIAFSGYQAIGQTAWSPLTSWQGDIRVEFKLYLASLGPGAEWFMGTWTGPAAVPPEPTSASGLIIRQANAAEVSVTTVFNAEELDTEIVPVGSFVSAEYQINAATNLVSVRLLQGDGLAVVELDSVVTNPITRHDGLVISLTGGSLLGSIARVTLDSGGDCIEATVPACDTCGSVEQCTEGICNPLFGCDIQEKYCPIATDCLTASKCEPATNTCTPQEAVDDGTACDVANECFTGSTCSQGQCQKETSVDCPPPNQCQDEGTCDNALGFCVYPSKDDGLVCNDESLCTDGETCQQGVCSPETTVECPQAMTCMTESVCLPDTGECSESVTEVDGAVCDDDDPCTESDICTSGECAGTAKDCDDSNPCTVDSCTAGECEATVDPSACLAWDHEPTSGAITGSPVQLIDGSIIGAGNGLFALESDGTVRWSLGEQLGALTTTGVVASTDGSHVAIASNDGFGGRILVLATTSGEVAWNFQIPDEECTGELDDPCRILALPTLNNDGTTAWVSTVGKGLFQVSAGANPSEGGVEDWSVSNVVGTRSSLTRALSGALYVGQGGNETGLRSLTSDGQDRWFFATSTAVDSTPIVQQQQLYITFGGTVTALTDDTDKANVNWTLTLGDDLTQTDAVLAAPDRLIVASAESLWAIDTTACADDIQQCIVWTKQSPLPGPISTGLVVLDDERVLYGANGGLQFLFIADGSEAFQLPLNDLILGTPLIGSNRIVVGDQQGKVHAFNYTPLNIANTGWPVSRRSQQRNPAE